MNPQSEDLLKQKESIPTHYFAYLKQTYLMEIKTYKSYHENLLKLGNPYQRPDSHITQSMRKTLVGWLIKVNIVFKQNQDVITSAVHLVDLTMIFETSKINRSNFQLLGITAFYIAVQKRYIQTIIPTQKFLYVCDGLYDLDQLISMKDLIVNSIKFDQLMIFPEMITQFILTSGVDKKFKKRVEIIFNLTLLDWTLSNIYKKAHLVGVILYYVSRQLNVHQFDPQQIKSSIEMSEEMFEQCFKKLYELEPQDVGNQPNPEEDEDDL